MTDDRDLTDTTDPTDLPIDAIEGGEPVQRRGARGAVIVGARMLTGLIGVAAAIVVLVAATVLPLPSHTLSPPSVLVDPVAASQHRVCAGPLLALSTASGGTETKPTSAGPASVSAFSTSGTVVTSRLKSTDDALGVAPALLTLPARDVAGSLFAGSESQTISAGDLVGFAASECAAGAGDSWLVGGSTSTGRTTLVTLSNPTEVASTAALTIYSENGEVSSAGTEGIDVPAGGQRVISLAAFAPGVESPVVRVQSRGGSIVANLQQSTVRTLDPGGVDIVDPSSAPGTSSVIPGFTIANSAGVFAQQGQAGYADLVSVVRLLAPGTEVTHAEISVIPENSTAKVAPAALVTLKPGIVTDVPLGSFPDGPYTLSVSSDHPVVAGARASTVGSAGQSDFAWYSAAQPLTGHNVVTVADGPSPVASVANPAGEPITVTVTPTAGAAVTVTVPAGGALTIPVAGGGYTVASPSTFFLTVSYLGDGELGAFSVGPPAMASDPIRVYG